MGPDWKQPFILIFEWGMFILGWGLVFILSLMALLFAFAVIKASLSVIQKKAEVDKRKTINPKGGSLDDNPPKI